MSLRERIDVLVKLQAIDLEMQEVRRLLDGVAGRIDTLDTELRSREDVLQKERDEQAVLQKKYRALESEVNANLPKISKSKGRLSSVKTNKEYQSLLKEIDDLTLMNSDIEDRMLECLEQMEEAERRLAAATSELKAFKLQVDADKERVREEAEVSRSRLEKLEKDWQAVCDAVDPGLLERFNRVRKQVGSHTIARVVQAVCEGCNVNIPPQMFNELQRCDELMFCPHCQRIIYTEHNG